MLWFIVAVLATLYLLLRVLIRYAISLVANEILHNPHTPRRRDLICLLKARFLNEIYGVCVAVLIIRYLLTTSLGVYLTVIPIVMLIIATHDAYTTYKYMKITKAII